MCQFVLLRHAFDPGDHRQAHWDLMFEADDALRTWSTPALPEEWLVNSSSTSSRGEADTSAGLLPMAAIADESSPLVLCRQLADHRLVYLDYEGPVSENRGRVTRFDRGRCHWLEDREDRIVVQLAGERMRGRLRLRRVAAREWEAGLLDVTPEPDIDQAS